MSVLAALWGHREERPWFVAATLVLLTSLLVWPAVDWWLRGAGIAPAFRFWDFGAYYAAAERWLYAEPIYRRNADGGFHGAFLYPPFVVAVFRQFALLPFRQAALAWEAVSVGLLWVGLQLVGRRVGPSPHPLERVGLLWLLLGFQPLLLSVKMGQTAGFMAGLLCLSFWASDRGADGDGRWSALGGALTGAVGTVKLAYAPVGAHLLRDRDRLAGAVAGGLALVAFSVAVFGVGVHRTYLDVLAWGFQRGGDARSPALWQAPYFRPLAWLGPSLDARIAASGVVAALALAADGADRETFALGVAAFPLLAPLAYTYYLVALLPAVAVLASTELDRPDGRPELVAVGLLLVHGHAYGLKFAVDVLPKWVPAVTALRPQYPFLQPGLWGVALLSGLAAVRCAEAAGLWAWLARVRRRARDRGPV